MEYYPTLPTARAELLVAHLWFECSLFLHLMQGKVLASCEKLCPFFWSKVKYEENNVGNTRLSYVWDYPYPSNSLPSCLTFAKNSWGLAINESPLRRVSLCGHQKQQLCPLLLPQLHVPTPLLSNRLLFLGIFKPWHWSNPIFFWNSVDLDPASKLKSQW